MTTTTATRKVARPIEKPIRTRADYRAMQAELDALIDADPKEGTPRHDRMELLAILIAAYEEDTIDPFVAPTPQELVKHMADMKGVSPGDLAEVMGGRSRLSDFYNKKRDLSTGQIVRLRELLGIPADLLLVSAPRPSLAAAGG
jgi:HTH-type transcriptional regulator/antitoxin HigA